MFSDGRDTQAEKRPSRLPSSRDVVLLYHVAVNRCSVCLGSCVMDNGLLHVGFEADPPYAQRLSYSGPLSWHAKPCENQNASRLQKMEVHYISREIP